jgi:high-affinity iron transporter
MGNVIIVMWRESLEAMLVVTILAGVIQRMGVLNGKRYLWIGVSVGIILSVALALGLQQLQARLPENAYDKFQAFLLLLAVALVTHMVIWMQRHGRKMKQELESDTHAALARTGLWGIGLVAALATTWLIGRGMRGFSYRAFFQTTGFLLLLFATSMLVTAIGQLTQLDLVPAMMDPVWNSAWLLDEHSAVGGPIAALTGYRSHPSLIQILTIVAFWALALPLMYRTPPPTRKE